MKTFFQFSEDIVFTTIDSTTDKRHIAAIILKEGIVPQRIRQELESICKRSDPVPMHYAKDSSLHDKPVFLAKHFSFWARYLKKVSSTQTHV